MFPKKKTKVQIFLPICSICKKIRDTHGDWNNREIYNGKYSAVTLSHSLCPECSHQNYPEYFDRKGNIRK